jgi:drug/metabolite transporter, DME family
MGQLKSSHPRLPAPWGLDPLLVGPFYGAASAVLYTAVNICLRGLIQFDPFLVSCVKAMPTMVLAGTMVAFRYRRGELPWPSWRALAVLAAAGAVAQLCGNAAFQWSLGAAGLAIAVPLCSGTMIVGAALLGRFWLGEGVTPRSALAMLVLIVSIVVLGQGTSHRGAATMVSTEAAAIAALVPWGAAAACLSGVAYAVLNVVIRRVVTGAIPLSLTLLTVSSVGVVSLGTASLLHSGWSVMARTPPLELAAMVGAGTINAGAFFLMGRALQWANLVEVNIVNASQTALAAVAGLFIFGEPATATLFVGVALSIAGCILVDRGRRTVPPPSQTSDAETAPMPQR